MNQAADTDVSELPLRSLKSFHQISAHVMQHIKANCLHNIMSSKAYASKAATRPFAICADAYAICTQGTRLAMNDWHLPQQYHANKSPQAYQLAFVSLPKALELKCHCPLKAPRLSHCGDPPLCLHCHIC